MQEKECTYTTAQVGRYMMNKMSPEEETLFQEHLISCPACHRKLQEMRNLAAALSANRPHSPAKREHKKRHFVKILVSIVLFFSGSYGIYWWQSHSRKKKSFHPRHPTFFTTRTRSKLRTRLTSREKPQSKPSPPAPDFSTHPPTEKRDYHPDNPLSNLNIGTYNNERSVFIPIY